MRKLLTFVMVALLAPMATAGEVKFINGDGSKLTQLCISAIDSDLSISALARQMNISPASASKVTCNGVSIESFVSRHSQTESDAVVYVFNLADESPVTRLCVTAITDKAAYEALKDEYFTPFDDVEENVTCNGMSLKKFIQRFSNENIEVASL